jgi:SAM-dependent methyltransferase
MLVGMSPAHDHNRRAWNQRARQGQRFAQPVADGELHDSLDGLNADGWLGDLRGKRLLCLAAGGGRQSVQYALLGAEVTVVDISPEMLRIDREVAAERGLNVRTIEASMDDLGALRPASFDVVIHPVSTCYVPDVQPVYREVARVTVPGGLYISQHKQPTSLQADVQPVARGYELIEPYYRQGPLPEVTGSLHREPGTMEFLHRWEELLGGLCRAGFVIEDITEPRHADPQSVPGTFKHRSCYVAPYVRVTARRAMHGASAAAASAPRLWTP